MRKKDDEKQRNIKEAVIKLILVEGFHGTSISKIAKEAGVSPATVYIYYENKEVMLHDIYREYSEEIFNYLLRKISYCTNGKQFIEVLVVSYYTYIQNHEEVFHFVEQFSSCPALANQCTEIKSIHRIYDVFNDLKKSGIIKNFCNDNLLAIIFSPIKTISINHCSSEEEKSKMLEELIRIIQDAILL